MKHTCVNIFFFCWVIFIIILIILKNIIDEDDSFIKIDYERQGTFKELWNYSRYLPCFDGRWLDDIFERHILVTNILK